jgi:hypothetical protein
MSYSFSSQFGVQENSRAREAQFSLRVGTIFEDSPIGLDKWLCAMWLIVNCKNGSAVVKWLVISASLRNRLGS